MSHFAKVENGIVTQVIVAEQDVIDSGLFGYGWVQTSYNTFGGQHPEGRPLRKNYAGIGFIYDAQRDAFIPPKLDESWTLNEETCLWVDDGSGSVVDFSTPTIDLGADSIMGGADSIMGGADSIVGGADSVNGVV
jgi:hypothetical protein